MPKQPRVLRTHYTSAYLKAYAKAPTQVRELQKNKERLFRENPFHPPLKTHKLKGEHEQCHSYSVNYHWRVLFRFISETEVIFYDIGTHEIYK